MADEKESTTVWFVSCQRSEDDRLMHDELEALESKFQGRFFYSTVLSSPHVGEGSRVNRTHVLPPFLCKATGQRGASRTHAVICGTDGFLEHVSGGKVRIKVPGEKKMKKLQGEVGGLLKHAGFSSEEVTKL